MILKTGIALFVYHRPQHTKKVLEGLKKNNINKLYIFSDGPKNEHDKEAVEHVRQLIESVDWCKTEIIRNEFNKGLAESQIFGWNYVLERHERIIVLEDDCFPSAGFVDYMERCLDKYENEERVMHITGYAHPIKISDKEYPYDVYFIHRCGSHGAATWKRAWRLFERDPNEFTKIAHSRKLRKKIDQAGKDIFYMLRNQIEGKMDSIAIWWAWTIIKNNGVCVTPVRSRVIDMGHDGTGVHGAKTNKYDVATTDYKGPIKFPNKIEINKKFNRRVNDFAAGSRWQIMQRRAGKLFRLITGQSF